MGGVDLNVIWHFSDFSEEAAMNTGKTLFAQLMDFLPWSTFARIVARYGGDGRVRTLSCAEQYRAMAFAQLTYRESLRDIETCLSAQRSKLYHMGFREPVRRSTLADANEGARLADLRRTRPAADRPGPEALRRRGSSGSTLPTPSTRSTRRPSICACRCFPGRISARPRRR